MKDKKATFRKQIKKTHDDAKLKMETTLGKEPLLMEEIRIRPNVIKRRVVRPMIDND